MDKSELQSVIPNGKLCWNFELLLNLANLELLMDIGIINYRVGYYKEEPDHAAATNHNLLS